MHIGFIGLGTMGQPMVERLCNSGFSVHIYARNKAAKLAAQSLGATVHETTHALAGTIDIVILCLYSDQQIRDLVLGPEGFAQALKPGATIIIHTTGSPQTAREIATAIAPIDGRVLDVPVSGGPHNISAGDITLLAGGDADTLTRCRPVLAAYGDPIIHTGELGSGQAVKLVNNLLFGAQIDLVSDASRILDQLGVDRGTALNAIGHCSGDSKVLQMAIRSGAIENLLHSAGRFIAKDRETANRVARELDIDTGSLGTSTMPTENMEDAP